MGKKTTWLEPLLSLVPNDPPYDGTYHSNGHQ
jgi:hypothetical protein